MANNEGIDQSFLSQKTDEDLLSVELSGAEIAFLMSCLENTSEDSVSGEYPGPFMDDFGNSYLEDSITFDKDLMETSHSLPGHEDVNWIDSELEQMSCSFPGDHGPDDMISYNHVTEFSNVIEFEGVGDFSQSCYGTSPVLEENVYITDMRHMN